MLQSEFLTNRIQEARENIFTLETPGWRNFLKDVVHPLEMKAFEKWKKASIEEVKELQIMGQTADIINAWPDKIRHQLEKDVEDLSLIQQGEEEDIDLEEMKQSVMQRLWRKITRDEAQI